MFIQPIHPQSDRYRKINIVLVTRYFFCLKIVIFTQYILGQKVTHTHTHTDILIWLLKNMTRVTIIITIIIIILINKCRSCQTTCIYDCCFYVNFKHTQPIIFNRFDMEIICVYVYTLTWSNEIVGKKTHVYIIYIAESKCDIDFWSR